MGEALLTLKLSGIVSSTLQLKGSMHILNISSEVYESIVAAINAEFAKYDAGVRFTPNKYGFPGDYDFEIWSMRNTRDLQIKMTVSKGLRINMLMLGALRSLGFEMLSTAREDIGRVFYFARARTADAIEEHFAKTLA